MGFGLMTLFIAHYDTARDYNLHFTITHTQWRAVHGSKGSIASVVKKRKEKKSYINNSI
jgi:hypothetical protein